MSGPATSNGGSPPEAVTLASPLVRVSGAKRTFGTELAPVRALRRVEFEVTLGEFIPVMDPSGCGKSTLLNVIAGLDKIDEATVEFAGVRIHGRGEAWLARYPRVHIGFVFQFLPSRGGVRSRKPCAGRGTGREARQLARMHVGHVLRAK